MPGVHVHTYDSRAKGGWKRAAPGEYEGTGALEGWTISRINYGHGDEWTAAKDSGKTTVLDPLPSLRRAKAAAEAAERGGK